MTADEFRQLALSQVHARMASRLGTIEFLVGDKVFATLGAPDPAFAILRLTPQDQAAAMAAALRCFHPSPAEPGPAA